MDDLLNRVLQIIDNFEASYRRREYELKQKGENCNGPTMDFDALRTEISKAYDYAKAAQK